MVDFNASRRRRQEMYQAALQRILGQKQAAESDYSARSSLLEMEKPNALRNVLNNFASRGMAFSSGYGQENQRVNTNYANQLSSLAAEKNARLTAAQQDEGSETAAFNYDLSDLSSQEAQYQAEQERQRVQAMAAQEQQFADVAAARAQAQQPNMQAGNDRQNMTRADFLKAHPNFAATRGEERKRFLRNHPGIAAKWARYN